MLNGSPLLPIQHGRGLRQGDPLSPLLFILTIEPLNQLLQVATDRALLTKLNGRAARFHVSMYADDAVVFLKPSARDATNLREILLNFGRVTGLQTNLQKTIISTISCDNIDLEEILAALPIARAHFPPEIPRLASHQGVYGSLSFNCRSTKWPECFRFGTGRTSLKLGVSASPNPSVLHNPCIYLQ
jgi:hypothetical protein